MLRVILVNLAVVVLIVSVMAAAIFLFNRVSPSANEIQLTAAEGSAPPAVPSSRHQNIDKASVVPGNVASPSFIPVQPDVSDDQEILALVDTNPNYATFGDRYTEISARRAGNVPDPRAILKASWEGGVWQTDETAGQDLNLTEAELTDGREFIQFNPIKLESLVAGDSFEISLAQTARTYTVIVEEVRSDDDGRNVTWSGRIDGDDGFNQVTLTRGKDLIVGGITTPDGYFQIQVQGDKGWIVNSATLFKGVDQQVIVPKDLIENPPSGVVYLPAETFGEHDITTH